MSLISAKVTFFTDPPCYGLMSTQERATYQPSLLRSIGQGTRLPLRVMDASLTPHVQNYARL